MRACWDSRAQHVELGPSMHKLYGPHHFMDHYPGLFFPASANINPSVKGISEGNITIRLVLCLWRRNISENSRHHLYLGMVVSKQYDLESWTELGTEPAPVWETEPVPLIGRRQQ